MTSGTAIDDALRDARSAYSCDDKYSGCKMKSNSFENVIEQFVRSLV